MSEEKVNLREAWGTEVQVKGHQQIVIVSVHMTV